MDWVKDKLAGTISRSHGVIAAASHLSTRQHLLNQCQQLARQSNWRLQVIEPVEGSIGIDQIRSLYRSTSYRRRGQESSLVVLSEAHTMTLPAQNAFLKLLEEPPMGVKFVLICPDSQSLLATVRSRCQIINFRPLPLSQFKQKFANLSPAEQTALYYASGGDIIEANSQLSGDGQGLQAARELLSKTLGQAVLDISDKAASRDSASLIADQLAKLAHAGLRHADTPDKKLQWLRRLQAGLDAKDQLAAQANSKMVLDKLLLEFRLG